MVSFSSCLNEQSSQANVVFAVLGISLNHCNNVGLCKFCHLDNVCSRTVRHLHAQHLLFAGIAEFGILGSFDVDEHHEDVGEEHAVFLLDLNSLLEIFSQALHEAFSCITVILFMAGGMLTNDGCVACLDVINSEEQTGSEH